MNNVKTTIKVRMVTHHCEVSEELLREIEWFENIVTGNALCEILCNADGNACRPGAHTVPYSETRVGKGVEQEDTRAIREVQEEIANST